MFKKIKLILIIASLFLLSCQKTEFFDEIVFDNSLLQNISINAENKEIIVSYVPALNKQFVDQVMETSPTSRIISWIDNNINNFGTMNKFNINIVKASIIRNEIESEIKVAGVIKKQNEYLYEMEIVLNFLLYSDDDNIISTTIVKVYRSTTSSKYISLNERNLILDTLTLESLKDLSLKSVELLKIHMSEYIL